MKCPTHPDEETYIVAEERGFERIYGDWVGSEFRARDSKNLESEVMDYQAYCPKPGCTWHAEVDMDKVIW